MPLSNKTICVNKFSGVGEVIVRRSGKGFVVHSSQYSICVDTREEICDYAVAVFGEGKGYDYCPPGKECDKPVEGWKDLLPFSVLIVPKGLVVTDGKASVGLWRVPEAVHVDFHIGDEPQFDEVPFQSVQTLEEGDCVEPLKGVVFRADEVHKMKLESRWFELIAKGEKVVEGRLYDEKRKRLRVGHVIEFTNVENNKKLYVSVRKIVIYKNFKEMLEKEKVARVLPGLDVESGVKVYEKFYGPDAGPVLGITVEVL